jgi:hypothetical protein
MINRFPFQKQKYIEIASAILCNTEDENDLLLHVESYSEYFSDAALLFFRTTREKVHFNCLKLFAIEDDEGKNDKDNKSEFYYDEQTKTYFLFAMRHLSSSLHEIPPFFSSHWTFVKKFVQNKTKHRFPCKNAENFIFADRQMNYDCFYDSKWSCSSCRAPLEIEFLPNINRKTIEVWSLWNDLRMIYYIEWIPEEVLKCILDGL